MKRILSEILRQPMTGLALILITLVVCAALLAPWLAPFPPDAQPFDGLSMEGAPLPPGPVYRLGTDTLGRDLLSRLLFGARTSLLIGLVANGVAVAIGMIVGVVAGYAGGALGNVLMRFTDLMMAFPALLLAIVLAALLHPSLWIVAMVIALVNWVQVARIVYTETRGLAERDFILAQRSLGAGHTRILLRHIAPHLTPTAIVWGTLGIATTVLLEATLSVPRGRRAAAAALLGQHHLREPELFSGGAVAGVHPRRDHPGDRAVVQPRRRRAARSARPDAAGAGLMAASCFRSGWRRRSADPVRRRRDHLPAAALSPRRSGRADRRAQRQRADDRQCAPSARARSADAGAVLALSHRPRCAAISAAPISSAARC